MNAAVVGHVEWIDFVRVRQLPVAGEIIQGEQWWEQPGGGGSVAAVQLSKLAGGASFFTALANNDLGRRAFHELSSLGVTVRAHFLDRDQRRAITFIDGDGERTITTLGKRYGPAGSDPLPWEELANMQAVYLTAGDAEAVQRARSAKVLVSTSRIVPLLARAEVRLDALVGSINDPSEVYNHGDIQPPPRLVVKTAGHRGGTFQVEGSEPKQYPPAPLPGTKVDTYGAGDSFAAGLTFALGAGYPPEKAVEIAAMCGAAVLTGRGPYEKQLNAASLPPAAMAGVVRFPLGEEGYPVQRKEST